METILDESTDIKAVTDFKRYLKTQGLSIDYLFSHFAFSVTDDYFSGAMRKEVNRPFVKIDTSGAYHRQDQRSTEQGLNIGIPQIKNAIQLVRDFAPEQFDVIAKIIDGNAVREILEQDGIHGYTFYIYTNGFYRKNYKSVRDESEIFFEVFCALGAKSVQDLDKNSTMLRFNYKSYLPDDGRALSASQLIELANCFK